ncbi:MarR family transcriptional regulator [Caproiciproducens galactitolivorans]|uniref:Transcriptional regulator SlyA n=1 Tax=Caproiciproducens galactitolivorans TaxID=642589 RepID=A0A4Z0Y762_9FIRM|nr:MarR family transcriptional regulator [Caproiciproducens galactitolivorans]QEY35818.1 MarR family transcriptional regulator [Caproiciproducens galactitolivorans]TGJ75758.1 transcriptional regulator SlyA [Caproiciproducens galactitolivorans]
MNDDIRFIVGLLGQIHILHRIYVHRALSATDIYFGQFPILEYVEKHEKCTQRELADTLQVSPPSIATSVKRMQKTGLLEKENDENDLRRTRISITEKGRAQMNQCRRAFDMIDLQMFEGFSEEETALFKEYLSRVIANLTTDEFRGKTMFSLIQTMTNEKHAQLRGKEGSI